MAKKTLSEEVKGVFAALRHIKHNGIRYESGELLELAEKEAAHLLGLGAVEPVADVEPSTAPAVPSGAQGGASEHASQPPADTLPDGGDPR